MKGKNECKIKTKKQTERQKGKKRKSQIIRAQKILYKAINYILNNENNNNEIKVKKILKSKLILQKKKQSHCVAYDVSALHHYRKVLIHKTNETRVKIYQWKLLRPKKKRQTTYYIFFFIQPT